MSKNSTQRDEKIQANRYVVRDTKSGEFARKELSEKHVREIGKSILRDHAGAFRKLEKE